MNKVYKTIKLYNLYKIIYIENPNIIATSNSNKCNEKTIIIVLQKYS